MPSSSTCGWPAIGIAAAFTFVAAMLPREAEAVTLKEIQARGKLVVATEAAYKPFEFVEQGKIVGYDKDILDLIVAAWGVQLEQLDLPFAGLLTGLTEKKYDFVCTALLMNPQRAEKYAFTMPIAQSRVLLIKRKGDTKVKTVDDLTGVVVGTAAPPGGQTAAFMIHNDSLKAANKAAKNVVFFQGSIDTTLALFNRQVDAAVNSTLTWRPETGSYPKDTFELVGEVSSTFWIGWVTRLEDLELRDAINVEIRKLRDSGKLAELQKKWFGFAMEIPDTGYLPPGGK
jgi:polar amino acid transport system substrate-binding protein